MPLFELKWESDAAGVLKEGGLLIRYLSYLLIYHQVCRFSIRPKILEHMRQDVRLAEKAEQWYGR